MDGASPGTHFATAHGASLGGTPDTAAQLLVDYGEQYWEGYASVLKQRRMMEAVVHSVRDKVVAPLDKFVAH